MIKASIVGASGYAGGEILRILLGHPEVQINQITSQKYAGLPVGLVHPNLRKVSGLKFESIDSLKSCDVLFVCLPNGESTKHMDRFKGLAKKVIDTGSDFRLNSLYGLAELHRDEIKNADFVACGGCEATASILALYPLYREGIVDLEKQTIIDAKIGSSAAGSTPSLATHHPERAGVVRSYRPTGHRHAKEVEQELGIKNQILISATSIEMVRGILVTAHVFLKDNLDEKEIWKIYRKYYTKEPFIRIVKEKKGVYRYPEPKIVMGTNFCDIGFEKDGRSNRLVVMSAVDNLVKGTAGQAVQAMNLMFGFPETLALEFPGLHPV